MDNTFERELSWEDTIEQDSTFSVLPAGEYDFQVVSFTRARHEGSPNLPPCPKAILDISIFTPEGRKVTVKRNLFLHKRTEGFLCEFFTSIGQRKRGEEFQMNWGKVPGSRGRCKLVVKKWNHRTTGEEMEGNEIDRFLEPGAKGFKAGEF